MTGTKSGEEGVKVRVVTKGSTLKLVEKAPEAVEEAFFGAVEKIQAMTLEQVMADNGLDMEKDQGRRRAGVWTFRLSRGWRALCLLRTGPVIEVFGIRNPTEAHSVRRR
jgi:hypothetical protein